MKLRLFIAVSIAAALATGCSPSRMAVRQAIDMSIRSLPVYDRETDVDFGELAVAGQIKLLEGLLESRPNDPELLLALTRAYSRYAYGFVQLKIECAAYAGSREAEQRWTAQAVDFYARARAYGRRLLEQAHPDLRGALAIDSSALTFELDRFTADEASALFWTVFAWGNELAHQPITPQSLIALGKTAQMMRRVVELDESVTWGSAHLYLGSYYSRLPAFLGGDRDRGEAHLGRAQRVDAGHYLPGSLLQAEVRWRASADTTGYIQALRQIVEAKASPLPEQNLDNAVARRQAGIRLANLDSSFICGCATSP